MLQKTKAISLSYIRYKESSIIAKFFTEQFGLQSFVVNGVRSPKSKMPAGLFQPLQLLDIVQYFNEKKELHRLVEIKPAVALIDLPFNPVKSAIAIFSAELVSKVIREGQANPKLFDLVWNWVIALDEKKLKFESLHLFLIWQMLQPLGIKPGNWQDIFEDTGIPGSLSTDDGNVFFGSIEKGNEALHSLSNSNRKLIMDALLAYMQKHLEGLGKLNSISILKDVFR